MLIWIRDFDVDEEIRAPRVVDALNAIGEAGYYGRHAVLGPRGTLVALARQHVLSRGASAYFKWISEAITQLGGIVAREPHLTIDASSVHPILEAGTWRVPLIVFSEPEYTAAAELLCENMVDCELLCEFAKVYAAVNAPDCVVKLRNVAGGGNATVDSLRTAMLDPNPITTCVVDSDRKLPGGALGDTARRCVQQYTESWRVFLSVIAQRELENAIPLEISVKVVEAGGGDAECLRQLRLAHADLADFACLKTGEDPCRFHEVPIGHQGKRRVSEALRITAASHPNFRDCGHSCGDCACTIFPALGDGFLRRVLRWLVNAPRRQSCLRPSEWPPSFARLIQGIAAAGLAFPRRNY